MVAWVLGLDAAWVSGPVVLALVLVALVLVPVAWDLGAVWVWVRGAVWVWVRGAVWGWALEDSRDLAQVVAHTANSQDHRGQN